MTAIPGPSGRPGPRAVIFDLDETLLDQRAAWQYSVEQAVALGCGRRINAAGLVEGYRGRPWRHALSVIVDDPTERARCEALCDQVYQRSAMKRLLVHDGLGVALDSLRGEGIEMAAISRMPHRLAVQQIRSTGLDPFLASLAATQEDQPGAVERINRCLTFLERPPGSCAFVSGDAADLEQAFRAGLRCFEAAWAAPEPTGFERFPEPSALLQTLQGSWH